VVLAALVVLVVLVVLAAQAVWQQLHTVLFKIQFHLLHTAVLQA
jgi:hypothetical protein